MSKVGRTYDLEERTAVFGEQIIGFIKNHNLSKHERVLADQLLRAATSIGANYMEAAGASSKKDFAHKMSICRKEAKETTYWLRMLAKAQSELKEECRGLYKEAHELVLIFSKSISSANRNDSKL